MTPFSPSISMKGRSRSRYLPLREHGRRQWTPQTRVGEARGTVLHWRCRLPDRWRLDSPHCHSRLTSAPSPTCHNQDIMINQDLPAERFVCVHGHFYQPPRENPWLEAIELQDSAYPFHDWNERITAECYAPNAAARILDGSGLINDISINYSQMSFNFGATLLSWMERAHLYNDAAIIE